MAGNVSHPASGLQHGRLLADVTLAIPMYNSAAFLEDLFASIGRLTILPREILIHDDASTDDSLSLVTRLVERYALPTTVCVLRAESNRGVAGAYNFLVQSASLPWIHILDADDFLVGDFYRALDLEMRSSGYAAIVGAAECSEPIVNTVFRAFAYLPLRALPRWLPVLGLFTTRSSIVYKTKLLKELPFPTPAFDGSDILHYLAVHGRGKVCFAPAAVVRYRIHPGGITRSAETHRYREALREVAPGPFYWLDFLIRKKLFSFIRR